MMGYLCKLEVGKIPQKQQRQSIGVFRISLLLMAVYTRCEDEVENKVILFYYFVVLL